MFRISDILVRIWIRIHGSLPLTNGPGSISVSCSFVSNLQDAKGFCLLLFGGTFTVHHSSKTKSHKEVKKELKSSFFLLFLLDDGRIRAGSGGRKKCTGPTGPDPEPWLKVSLCLCQADREELELGLVLKECLESTGKAHSFLLHFPAHYRIPHYPIVFHFFLLPKRLQVIKFEDGYRNLYS